MDLWLRPIRVLVTSAQGGMIEVVGGAVSLHQTKRQTGERGAGEVFAPFVQLPEPFLVSSVHLKPRRRHAAQVLLPAVWPAQF